jgi:uncharacterized protein
LANRKEKTVSTIDRDFSRRKFIAGCAATTTALGFARCGGEGDQPCAEPGPDENVNQRQFDSYSALAELDYFELTPSGRLRCTVDMPPAIDVHIHLALAYYFAPPVDLTASHERVQHIFDCDVEGANCPIDLDVYANMSLSEEVIDSGSNAIIASALNGEEGGPLVTHTIPNLLVEMEELGLYGGWLLPIAMNFDYDLDNPSEKWRDAVVELGVEDRFKLFASIHPEDPRMLEKVESFAEQGFMGIKIHSGLQGMGPNTDECMAVYQACDRLGLSVFWHSGRSGLELPGQGRNVDWPKFVEPVREFPNIDFVLGHSGARDNGNDAVALAKENSNCWMCLAGPSIPAMETILAELGPERMLYGTDWPFYPQAMQLAKVLVMTRCDTRVRDMILHENAERFVSRWG